MSLRLVKGNIFSYANSHIIVQQCNCVSEDLKGLAQKIYRQYPDTDTRQGRRCVELYGRCLIGEMNMPFGVKVRVANLYAQIYPGKPALFGPDSAVSRLEKFREAFIELTTATSDVDSLAIPKNIGSGLAKGNWEDYAETIRNIANDWCPKREIIVVDFGGD
jgi:O-acetyl-ADP-ribose deacetylase (regulator of RNase III)